MEDTCKKSKRSFGDTIPETTGKGAAKEGYHHDTIVIRFIKEDNNMIYIVFLISSSF